MRSISIVLLAAVACGGGKKSVKEPAGGGSGSDEPPPVVAQTLLGWGRQAATGGKTNVFLEVTDHTGVTRSYPLGDSPVPCQPARGNGTDIITSLLCLADGSGSEFRAVYRNNEIIVLRRPIDPSDDPADIELSFREIERIGVPVGSKVSAAET